MPRKKSRPPNKPGAGGNATVHTDIVDKHIAERLRFRRTAMNLHIGEFAKLCGISRFTVMRYELSQNRVPASTLMIFATVLRVPIGYFFEEDTYAKTVTLSSETQPQSKAVTE